MTMGEQIKQLRLERNMTLEELGNKVGVGKSTVRKWENGMIANMRRDKIAKLASALDVSPAYLMGWEQLSEGKAPVSTIKKMPSKQEELINVYDQLSSRNQDKVLTYSKSLLTKQQLDDEVYEVAAAHDRTDIEMTAEGRQHDIDLMNDDSKWE